MPKFIRVGLIILTMVAIGLFVKQIVAAITIPRLLAVAFIITVFVSAWWKKFTSPLHGVPTVWTYSPGYGDEQLLLQRFGNILRGYEHGDHLPQIQAIERGFIRGIVRIKSPSGTPSSPRLLREARAFRALFRVSSGHQLYEALILEHGNEVREIPFLGLKFTPLERIWALPEPAPATFGLDQARDYSDLPWATPQECQWLVQAMRQAGVKITIAEDAEKRRQEAERTIASAESRILAQEERISRLNTEIRCLRCEIEDDKTRLEHARLRMRENEVLLSQFLQVPIPPTDTATAAAPSDDIDGHPSS